MMPGVPLPKKLGEFCDPVYWDAFFKSRGGRPFEWYGEWKHISKLLTVQCGLKASSGEKILVPGCGNSALSADMYDAGFSNITNIDFSRVVISEMLRKHVRSRQGMRWLVMDMTKMQLPDASFDVVVDKGGLDALLGEPEDDRSSGAMFLSEVQRVLKPDGRFACITLAQQHVVELLLSIFRDGWCVSVHGLQLSAADAPSSLQPFLVIARQEDRPVVPLVSIDVDLDWRGSSNQFQMQAVVKAIDVENGLRNQGLANSRKAEGPEVNPHDSYENLHPGRRLTTKLGSQHSQFTYTGVILDAKNIKERPEYRCAVFLVPKGKAHEWLFSSVEGQWQVAEGTKAGRLILVMLDPNQPIDNILDVKDDLSPLVKSFLPLDCRESRNVPYLTQGDGIASRNILDEVVSPMTGAMLVEDVVLADENWSTSKPACLKCFRRLVFRRNPNLIQSEALLLRGRVASKSEDKGRGPDSSRKHGASKRKKKVTKEVLPTSKPGMFEGLKVDHSYLASPYHEGMIAAFVLIANNLEQWLAAKQQVRLMLVGLGAGLLPMFIHNHLPITDIEVVELDPVVGEVAKRHFGFIEDGRMRLKVGDGIVAVQAIAATTSTKSLHDLHHNAQGSGREDFESHAVTLDKNESGTSPTSSPLSERRESNPAQYEAVSASHTWQDERTDVPFDKLLVSNDNYGMLTTETSPRLHILIVDADSEDPSSGLSCPPPEFLEDPFLLAARRALEDGGILIINVVSRATSHHVQYVSQLKKFFEEVYDIEVSEDVNRVLIALPQPRNGGKSTDIMKDLAKLERIITQFAPWESGPKLASIVRDLKRLK